MGAGGPAATRNPPVGAALRATVAPGARPGGPAAPAVDLANSMADPVRPVHAVTWQHAAGICSHAGYMSKHSRQIGMSVFMVYTGGLAADKEG